MEESEIIDIILKNRNITDKDEFLYPDESSLFPFLQMKNIKQAADIIWNGICEGKSFLIYADVDVDGCTSGAIMYRYLKKHTNNVKITINQGKKHGIKECDLDQFEGIDIVIIVDSINSSQEYRRISDLGIEIVVLDHHIIPNDLDETDILLVSSANKYPNPNLSGSGVVWKFCKYIDYITLNDYADDLVDLAACGIIADMCNVNYNNQENRYICTLGFQNQQTPGIKKINGSYKFNGQAVSFGIAPLVNSANRINQNQTALNIFISDDSKEITSLIKKLKEAKENQNAIVKSLLANIKEQADTQIDNKVLLFVVDTDASISGLLGNKLVEKYQRPVLVLKRITKQDENNLPILVRYSGSGRGIGIDNFKQYVDATGLAWTGGHENAFGIEIQAENYLNFQKVINEALSDIAFENVSYIDIQINEAQITSSLIDRFKEINQITGEGFKPLTVLVSEIKDYELGTMGNGKHLKITTPEMTYIKWNFSGDAEQFDNDIEDIELSFVGKLDSGFFGRQYTKQLIIDDYLTKVVNA